MVVLIENDFYHVVMMIHSEPFAILLHAFCNQDAFLKMCYNDSMIFSISFAIRSKLHCVMLIKSLAAVYSFGAAELYFCCNLALLSPIFNWGQ